MMKIRPIQGINLPLKLEPLDYKIPEYNLGTKMSFSELDELHVRISHDIADKVKKILYFDSDNYDGRTLLERESVAEMLNKMQNTEADFGAFKLPPPRVTEVSYTPEDGYVVKVDMALPPIPSWVDIRASFNDAAFNQNTDIQGETFEDVSMHSDVPPPTDLPVDNYFDYQVDGNSVLKLKTSGELIIAPGGPFEIAPPGRPLEDPGEELRFLGTPTPVYLRSSSTKPLMYSMDVYRSLKEGQYVAVVSFPVISSSDSTRIKPYAVGSTVQEAGNKLADNIRAVTGRKELGIINEHMHITEYLCVHCTDVHGYPTRNDLVNHIGQRHGGNVSLDKYTNSEASGVWRRLP